MALQARRHRIRNFVFGLFSGMSESLESFRARNYMFDPSAGALLLWDWFIAACAIYSAVSVPLFIVFDQSRWDGYDSVDLALDILFMMVREKPRVC